MIPIKQSQIPSTIKWIEEHIFPNIGITGFGVDASMIGSAGKKPETITSHDLDIAVSVEKISSYLECSTDEVLVELDTKLNNLGFSTSMIPGFKQVSFGAAIAGDSKNGLVQTDLMLSNDIKWSEFIYHSPDLRSESKYKGVYRNLLLMAAISNSYRIIEWTDDFKPKAYETYVVRLNEGIVKVRKSFEGKRGLLKRAKLLKEHDEFITKDPQTVVDLLFRTHESAQPITYNDIDTYEKLKQLIFDSDWSKDLPKFMFPEKRRTILEEFKCKLETTNLEVPSDIKNKTTGKCKN